MSNLVVRIDDDRGFWYRSDTTFVRGHAFSDGELYRPEDLLALVEDTPVAEFERLVSELNGFFAIVRKTDDAVYLAVDHVQSLPLFYGTEDGDAYVSNDAHWIVQQLTDPGLDPLLEFECLLTGVVTGRDTLYPNVKQLQAGECVVIDGNGRDVSVAPSRYSRFEHRPALDASESELLDALDAVVERSFRRLIEVADGRQLVISLSGGPDSRLIACMLRRLEYPNLAAFTYGREDNWDSTTAAEVAAALEIPLEVVRYDHDLWYEWFGSDERRDYYRYAFDFDALPSIGAVPAVGHLARSGAIEDDAIVLCGNIATSRNDYKQSFRRAAPSTASELASYVVDRFYKYWKWDDDEAADAFRSRVESQIDVASEDDERAAVAAFKDWRIRNVNAKLMVVPQEYTYWGFDSWTPLWDAEYVRFWERVPLRFRADKRLHRTYVEEIYRELTGGERSPGERPSTGPLRRVEGAIARSPLARVVRPVHERFEESYKRLTRESPYYRDPVATTGIVTEAQFEELCYSYDQNVHPFKALELLGCVSFDPPDNAFGPKDGRLDRDRLCDPERVDRRESLPWFRPSRTPELTY